MEYANYIPPKTYRYPPLTSLIIIWMREEQATLPYLNRHLFDMVPASRYF
jgi:hypothetical protein